MIHVRFRRFYSAGKGKKTVEEIAHMIATRQVRNIVVMAGAGISTASGIPDFRYSICSTILTTML